MKDMPGHGLEHKANPLLDTQLQSAVQLAGVAGLDAPPLKGWEATARLLSGWRLGDCSVGNGRGFDRHPATRWAIIILVVAMVGVGDVSQ